MNLSLAQRRQGAKKIVFLCALASWREIIFSDYRFRFRQAIIYFSSFQH